MTLERYSKSLLPILYISSISVMTWLFPRQVGYLLVGGILAISSVYLIYNRTPLDLKPAQYPFIILFGTYWIGLIIHFLLTTNTILILYIMIAPVVIYTAVFQLPHLVTKSSFIHYIVYAGVLIVASGVVFLAVQEQFGVALGGDTGRSVFGLSNIRISSIFRNSNMYGFFIMIAALCSVYKQLHMERGGVNAIAISLLLFIGLFLSDSLTAMVAFVSGLLMLIYTRSKLGFGVAVVLSAAAGLVALLFAASSIQDSLMGRWHLSRATILTIIESPWIGNGFGSEGLNLSKFITEDQARTWNFSPYSSPHNSYLHIMAETGVFFGGAYIGAFIYVLYYQVTRVSNSWDQFTIVLWVAVAITMLFETTTLGGLSMLSIAAAIVVGFCLTDIGATDPSPNTHGS